MVENSGHEGHVHSEHHHTGHSEKKPFYDRYYKLLLIIPILMLLSSIAYVSFFYTQNHDIMHKDVTLTGGTSITIYNTNLTVSDFEKDLSAKFPDIVVRSLTDVQTGKQIAISIESSSQPEPIKQAIEGILGYTLDEKNSSTEFTGNSLSQSFYQELLRAMIIAFVFMSIVIFVLFRSPLPSFYVIACAFADIMIPLAIVDFFGMRISTAGIAAFLMLIGYSVDTDILLTTVVLKRKEEETLNKRILSAVKTGLTMTLTALATVLIAYFMSLAPTLKQIFLILAIGLTADMIITWLMNASLLKWYCEKRGYK